MPARLYLVRHGKAAAGWDADPDPGLDDTGRAQAEAMAARLADLGPLPIVCSPLRRTRETAVPLETRWRAQAVIEPDVAEVPSPSDDLAARGAWLRRVMAGTWAQAGDGLAPWRQGVVDRLTAIAEDTVVISHFIAINVAVGAATGDDRVVGFRPDNCSVTVLESDGSVLRLVERGVEAVTEVR